MPSLSDEIDRLRALLADQELVQSDMENQIIILTQRLTDADRSDEIAALQAEIARLRAANDDKQNRITGLESTLLVLVSALAGTEFIRRAYQTAIENRYRFYSYGDAMLIL